MRLDLFSIEGEHPRSAEAILRRLALWTIVCWVSGGPSFGWALMGPGGGVGTKFDPLAMALGITLFAIGYTVLTSTDAFDVFQRRPGVRLTLYIGYFTRLGVSIAFPIAMAADLIPGMFSVAAAQTIFEQLGAAPNHSRASLFLSTLLTTCIQGALLNFVISLYMLVVYGLVRWSGKGIKPQRGFEVILPEALPVAQTRTDPPEEAPAR